MVRVMWRGVPTTFFFPLLLSLFIRACSECLLICFGTVLSVWSLGWCRVKTWPALIYECIHSYSQHYGAIEHTGGLAMKLYIANKPVSSHRLVPWFCLEYIYTTFPWLDCTSNYWACMDREIEDIFLTTSASAMKAHVPFERSRKFGSFSCRYPVSAC